MNFFIWFDIDCVLNTFEDAFCDRFGYENREMYCLSSRYPERKEEIQKWVNDPRTYTNLKVNPAAFRLYQHFREQNDVFLGIATSRPSSCYHGTIQWLDDAGIVYDDLVYSPDKVSKILNRVKVVNNGNLVSIGEDGNSEVIISLIDDNVSFLKDADASGLIQAVAWRKPWNEEYLPAYLDVRGSVYGIRENGDTNLVVSRREEI